MNKTVLKIVACVSALVMVFYIKKNLPTKTVLTNDTAVLAWNASPRSIDPRYVIDANSQYLEDLIHCSLFTYNETGALVPMIAKGYVWQDPQHLQVEINQGAKYWDGSEVTLDDVLATYQFFLEAKSTGAPRKGAFKNIEYVKKISPSTLEFGLKKPEAAFATNLILGILPKAKAEGERITEKDDLMGCGPFKLHDLDSFNIHLTRNEHVKAAEGSIPKVLIKIVKQESTRFAKLVKGELDLVQNGISADKLQMIGQKYPDLKISKRSGLNVTYLGFNFRDKFTGNRAVRKAISLAIDREAIIKHVLRGNATLAKSMLTPEDPYLNNDLLEVKMDLNLAKEVLDKSGFVDPDGDGPKKRFKLTYKTTNDVTRVTIAKAIASQLSQIGIEVEVLSLEWGKFKEDVEKGQVQLWSLSWVGFKDPNIFNYTFSSEHFPPNGGNRGRYKNAELDKLLADGESVVDKEQRKDIYHKVQEIVAEELPYVFLWHEDLVAVHHKRLKNYKVFADGRLQSLVTVSKE